MTRRPARPCRRLGGRRVHHDEQKDLFDYGQGERALHAWLREPLDFQPAKSKIMIKVFFGNQMDHGDLVGQIKERREQESGFLAKNEHTLARVAEQFAIELDAKDEMRFWMLTADFVVRRAKMIVEWCDAALKIL